MANGNTDTRIVELQFENRSFEKNIAKSQKSIEELKEAMDFEETSKGLEKFSKGMDGLDFSRFETNLQRLADKFTGLGNVWEYVTSRIRYSLESTAQSVESFVKSLSVAQISVGQNKYDQLNKAVMTIISGGKATEQEAYTIMERVMAYTDQTSHDFNTMIGQTANLTSIGKGLNESERLIEAIGNAATFAGGNAQQAATSMGVLTKAFSSNFLGYEQFLQLSQTARVITDKWREQALEAAEAVGTLKRKNDKLYINVKGQKAAEVTVQNLETTLRSKWLTGEVLEKLYSNYQFGDTLDELAHPEKVADSFGKTAYLTGQRALSFADAMNALKESVSSGWMQSFRLIFGDVTEAAEHFTNVADRVLETLEKIKDFRNDVLKSWASKTGNTKGGRSLLMELLLGDYEDDAEEGVVGFMDLLDGLGKIVYDGFVDFMMLFGDPVDRMHMKDDPAYFRSWLGTQLKQIMLTVQDFMGRIKKFFNEEVDIGGESKTRLEVISDIVKGISGALSMALQILEGVTHFMAKLGEQLTPGLDSVLDFLGKLGLRIYETAESTGDQDIIFNFFDDLAAKIKPITDGINDVVSAITNFLSVLLGLDEESDGEHKALTTILDLFLRIGDTIAKITGPVLSFIGSVIDLVAELIKGDINLADFGKKMGEAIKTMMQSFADNLPDSLSFLGDWIRDLFGLWEDDSEDRSKSFFTFLHKLFTGSFESFSEMLGSLTNGLSLTQALKTGFGFGDAFNFLNTMIGFFKGTNLYGLVMAFLGVTAVGGLVSLILRARTMVNEVTAFFGDVGDNLIHGISGEYEWTGDRILKIITAIGIIVAAIAVLGSMNPTNLIQGILGVGAIMAMLFLFFKSMSKYSMTTRLDKQILIETIILTMAGAVVAIAAALSILALALYPLASDPKKMITAVLGLAAMLGILFLFFKIVLDKMDTFTFASGGAKQWSGIGKMAVTLLALSVSIGILAVALGALAVALTPLALTGWEGVGRAILAFAAMLAGMGLFINIMLNTLDDFAFKMGGGKTDWSSIGKMAVMMLALAATVGLLAVGIGALVIAITPLAVMSAEGVAKAIIGLGLIMAELGMMIKYLQSISTADKSISIKIAGLTAFAFGIGVLVMALVPLAIMPWNAWIRAMDGLLLVLVMLAGMIFFVSKMDTGDKSASLKIAGLAAFAFGIALLIQGLKGLAGMQWDGWARAMIGLGLVLAELIGFMWLIKKTGVSTKGMNIEGIVAFTLGIWLLMQSLYPLASMEWDGWARAMIGLGLVLAEIIGFMWLIKETGVSTKGLNIVGIVLFAAGIWILMQSLQPLATMSQQGWMQALAGLGIVLLEVAMLMVLIKGLGMDIGPAIAGLLLILGVAAAMVLVSLAFENVKDVDWKVIAAFTAGLTVLAIGLSVAAAIADAIGLRGFAILAAGLALIIGAIALIAPILIGSVMGAIRNAAGDLTIIGGLMGSFSESMEGVGESGFDKASRLIDKLAGIVLKLAKFVFAADSTKAFMTAMSQLTLAADEMIKFDHKISGVSDDGGYEKAHGIVVLYKKLFDEDLSGFGAYAGYAESFYSAMFNLGSAFDYFNNMTNTLGDAEDNQGLQLIKQLAGCAPNLDTIYKMDLDKLKTQLAELGGAMIIYAKGAESVNGGEITDDTDVGGAITLLKKISESFSEAGGFSIPENMPKDDELTNFGVQLAALAGALVSFEEAGKGLGTGTANAIRTIEFFEQLKAQLSTYSNFGSDLSGAIQTFKDENGEMIQKDELTQFGEDIAKLGSAMAHFAESTQVVNQETGEITPIDYSMATSALDSIVSLQEKLPNVGGVVQVITGTKEDLGDLATQLNLLGDALKNFHNDTHIFDEANGTVTPMDYSNTTEFLGKIKELSETLNKIKIPGFNLESLILSRGMTLGDLSGQLSQLGVGLNGLSGAISGTDGEGNQKFDSTKANEAIAVLNDSMVPFMQTLASKLPHVGGLFKVIETAITGREFDLTDFGTQLGGLAKGLGDFGENISRGKWNSDLGLSSVFSFLDSMVALFIRLDEFNKQSTTGTISSFAQSLNSAVSELLGETTLIDNLADFIDKMNYAMYEYTADEGITSAVQGRMQLFKTFAEGLNALTNSNFDVSWSFIGSKLTTDIAGKIIEGTTDVTTAFNNMLTALTTLGNTSTSGESGTSTWVSLGEAIAAGVQLGISNGSSGVIQAAVDMATAAYIAAKASIDSNSPSRLFMELGAFMGEGMAIGMTQTTDEVGENAGALGETALEEAKNIVAMISTVMAEDANAHPTISPILDLTNLNEGMASFRESLTGYGLRLDTSGAAASAGRIGTAGTEETAYRPDYSGIYARIDQLGIQVQQLGASIRSMKIVLNTGTVAGGVVDHIDNDLGRRMFYAGRNN